MLNPTGIQHKIVGGVSGEGDSEDSRNFVLNPTGIQHKIVGGGFPARGLLGQPKFCVESHWDSTQNCWGCFRRGGS